MTHQLEKQGHFQNAGGGLWALHPKCAPVSCRDHQLATAHYIRKHIDGPSAILSLLPKPTSPAAV